MVFIIDCLAIAMLAALWLHVRDCRRRFSRIALSLMPDSETHKDLPLAQEADSPVPRDQDEVPEAYNGSLHQLSGPAGVSALTEAIEPTELEPAPLPPPNMFHQLQAMEQQVRQARESLDCVEDCLRPLLDRRLERQILPYLESLEAQLTYLAQRDLDSREFHASITPLQTTVFELMKVMKLEPITPEPGERFDHSRHCIIKEVGKPLNGKEAVVQEVTRKGWRFSDGQLIRSAEVIVGPSEDLSALDGAKERENEKEGEGTTPMQNGG